MEYILLNQIDELPVIRQFAPFKAVLAIEDSVEPSQQGEISSWLVSMGCLYVMICGSDAASWEASIRRANLQQVALEDMRPQDFVMITAHPHEKLRSVLWHAKKVARHTHARLEHTVAIHIGQQNRSVEYHAMFDKA